MKSHKDNAMNQSQVIEFDDGRTFDPNAYRRITQQWIDDHMALKEQSFTKPANCNIVCATWNVNAKKQEEGLETWLRPNSSESVDIYAIGFQEIVDLNAMNVALNSSTTQQKAQYWIDHILTCLNNDPQQQKVQYQLVMQKTLVGILLCIFAADSLLPQIKDVRATTLGVGLMGMMGNKGGVSVRMSVYDTTICFVCSHLAAHRENVLGRNSDYKNIYEKSIFLVGDNQSSDMDSIDYNASSSVTTTSSSITATAMGIEELIMPQRTVQKFLNMDLYISDHEIVYWFGDLNYRIDQSLTTEHVFHLIELRQYEELRLRDQLIMEMKRGAVFHGFEEGLLTFAPTYKYQPGTDKYETRAEKKLRAPAWCDRILWKCTGKTMGMVQLVNNSYNCASLNPSDHKPVRAAFKCELRTVVEEQQRIVFDALMLELVRFGGGVSNGSIPPEPEVIIDRTLIRFEKIKYLEKYLTEIDVKNVGQTVAVWHFVNKLEELKPSKPWISLDRVAGLLLPDESVKIGITVSVDLPTAHVLNAGKDNLEDLLHLRIENGSNFHISISASYERSCFGVSLEELLYTMEPFSKTLLPTDRPIPEDSINDGNISAAHHSKLSIPKELWRLIDALWTSRAIEEPEIFNTTADAKDIAMIRHALDTGTGFPIPCSPHALAQTLVEFLASLQDPVLPVELQSTVEIEPAHYKAHCHRILEELPNFHYNVFVYVISFLREVLALEQKNRCTPLLLATVATSCLMQGDSVSNENDGISRAMLREEYNKQLQRKLFMQPIFMYFLTSANL